MGNTTAYAVVKAVAEAIERGWAKQRLAKVTVAGDPAHALDLLTGGVSGGCAVTVFYLSDSPAGTPFNESTMVEAAIRVGIVSKQGLAARGGGDVPDTLGVVDAFRRWFAGVKVKDVDGVRYAGMSPVAAQGGQLLNGYFLTYKIPYAFDV